MFTSLAGCKCSRIGEACCNRRYSHFRIITINPKHSYFSNLTNVCQHFSDASFYLNPLTESTVS
jgi:hypothetical protein